MSNKPTGITGDRHDVAGRFWPKVEVRGPDDCWEWQGCTDRKGYGHIWIRDGMVLAHRASLWLHGGNPEGIQVLHHCDNPPCVNPRHLYEGTDSDNMRDAYDRGRKSNQGEGNARSILTEKDVREIRALLNDDDLTQGEIGEQYGVAGRTISNIATGRTWSSGQPTDDHD